MPYNFLFQFVLIKFQVALSIGKGLFRRHIGASSVVFGQENLIELHFVKDLIHFFTGGLI